MKRDSPTVREKSPQRLRAGTEAKSEQFELSRNQKKSRLFTINQATWQLDSDPNTSSAITNPRDIYRMDSFYNKKQ